MEITLVGLQNAGKSTLVNVIAVTALYQSACQSAHPPRSKPPLSTLCWRAQRGHARATHPYPASPRRRGGGRRLTTCASQSGHYVEDMIPTVGFNMRKVNKGKVPARIVPIWWGY